MIGQRHFLQTVDTMDDQIRRIRDKVVTNSVSVHDPISDEMIANFETRYAVQLPDGSRKLLLHVGDGCDTPMELFPLHTWKRREQTPSFALPCLKKRTSSYRIEPTDSGGDPTFMALR